MTQKRINRAAPRRYRRRYPSQRLLFWSWKRDDAGDFRVHARHVNHAIAWSSSEGYRRRARAVENAMLFGAPSQLLDVAEGVEVEALSPGEAP